MQSSRPARSQLAATCALGGIIGPTVFVMSWITCGLVLPHYSFIHDAISELARKGRPTHTAMTSAFAAFAVCISLYSIPLKNLLGPKVAGTAFITALGTLGVAAEPLGTQLSDHLHFTYAGISYVALATGPVLASFRLEGNKKRSALWTGVLIATALIYSVLGPVEVHGLFQRIGLTIGDVWFVVTAGAMPLRRSAQSLQSSDRQREPGAGS